jgi:hypothetical protein
MKHVIKFNGEELINKSEAIKILGFSQLRSIDYFIEKGKLDAFEILGVKKKLLSRNQVEAFKAKRGYSNG